MPLRWVGLLAVLLIPVPSAHGATAAVLGTGGGKPTVAVEPSGVGHAAWHTRGSTVDSDTVRYCRLPRANPTSCQSPQTLTPPGGRGDDVHVLVSGTTVQIVMPRYVQDDVHVWTSTGGAPFAGPVLVATGDIGTDNDDVAHAAGGSALLASSNPSLYAQQFPLAGAPPATGTANFGQGFTSFVYAPTIGTFGPAATPLLAAAGDPQSPTPQVAFWRYAGAGDANTAASWAGPTVIGQGQTPRLAGGPSGLFLMTNAQTKGQTFDNQMQARRFDEASLTFGAPVNVGPTETGTFNDIAQAQAGGSAAGKLFAAWVSSGKLRLSTSANGAAWAVPVDIVREDSIYNLRVEVAPDGQGFAVWDQNRDNGQVRAAPLIPIQGSGGADSKLTPTQVIKLPSSKRCRSRRAFRIRLVVPRGVIIATASVRVNGKRVKVVRRRRLTSFVNLRGLPRGRYTVKIVVVTEAGKILTSTRRYRTCVPRRRG